jgi:TonB family protein
MVEYRPAVRSSGTVILSLTIGPDGNVLDTVVKESTGDQAMAEAALRVVDVMKFEPAMIGDQAIKSVMELPFNFATN